LRTSRSYVGKRITPRHKHQLITSLSSQTSQSSLQTGQERRAVRGGRRVLIIVQNLPVPFDRRVWLEATTLQRSGFEVTVICPKLKGWNRGREVIDDVEIYRYPLPIDAQGPIGYIAEFAWCFLCTTLLSIRVAISGRGFDVIHACNPPDTYWLLARFWGLLGKRFLFDHHDLSPEMYVVKFSKPLPVVLKGLRWLERQTFRTAQVVITTNESHKNIAVTRGRVASDRVYVVRSGPDLRRFQVVPSEPEWRAGKPFLIAYLGEICPQDGVENLIDALGILREELGRHDFHCVLIGGGPHARAVRDHADQIGVADLCTFVGDVYDSAVLCRILSSAHLGVVPDPKNPYSDISTMNKVMEYMFFGLPVTGFNLTENRFSAGEAAEYATGKSSSDLARRISGLLDDPQKRERMGEIGRRRVAEQLAWEHSVPNLMAAYDRIFDRT
jgi:glycosyltransferase involved in cell wall biosynthesis